MDELLKILILFIAAVIILAVILVITVIMINVLVDTLGYIYDCIFASIVVKIGHYIGKKIPGVRKNRIIYVIWNNVLNSPKCFRYQIPCISYCFSYLVVLVIASLFKYDDLTSTIVSYAIYGIIYFVGMAKRYKVNKEEYSKVLDNNMAFLKLSFMPVGFVITFFGFLFTITGVKVQDLNFDSNFIFEIIRNINFIKLNIVSIESCVKTILLFAMLLILLYVISLPFQVISYFVISVINYARKYKEAYMELINNYKKLLKK